MLTGAPGTLSLFCHQWLEEAGPQHLCRGQPPTRALRYVALEEWGAGPQMVPGVRSPPRYVGRGGVLSLAL